MMGIVISRKAGDAMTQEKFSFTTVSVHREQAAEIRRIAAQLDLHHYQVVANALKAYAAMRDLNAAAFKPQMEVRA
jgi:hypothetical protein